MVASTFPWFGVVGAAYATRQAVALPRLLDLLFRPPAAYLTVGSVVVLLWVAVDRVRPGAQAPVTIAGGLALLAIGALALALDLFSRGSEVLLWNGVAVAFALGATAVVWGVYRWRESDAVWVGLGSGVLFAHVLDAATTGVGLAALGTVERNPIAASIIAIGDTAALAHSGIAAFLGVKIAVALATVSMLAGSAESGREEAALLVVAGGVGLAPAVHNLVLFSLTVS
jgi:uncharacterized membrane protein